MIISIWFFFVFKLESDIWCCPFFYTQNRLNNKWSKQSFGFVKKRVLRQGMNLHFSELPLIRFRRFLAFSTIFVNFWEFIVWGYDFVQPIQILTTNQAHNLLRDGIWGWGQSHILVFLTPRPALSSHQQRPLVCLYWSGDYTVHSHQQIPLLLAKFQF